MCGSTMGMVFCPPSFGSNGGSGFSLVFKDWVIHNSSSYGLALLGVFCMGALRQCLATLRASLPDSPLASAGLREEALLSAPAPLRPASPRLGWLAQRPWLLLGTDTALFAATLLMSYLNMLVAMAYDAGLLLSLVLGEAAVYLVVKSFTLTRGRNNHRPLFAADDANCH